MCTLCGLIIVWSIASVCMVLQTTAAVSGEHIANANIRASLEKETDSIFLLDFDDVSSKTNSSVDRDKRGQNYSFPHLPSATGLFHDHIIRTRYHSTGNRQSTPPQTPNSKSTTKRRKRRETRPSHGSSTSKAVSLPIVKIIVREKRRRTSRVKRGQTRPPDFTQVNRDVCPPSLCRVLDERSRGGGGRPRGTGGTVFYQGDIVLDRDLDRVIYPSMRTASAPQMRRRNQKGSRAGRTMNKTGSSGKRRKNRKNGSGTKTMKGDSGEADRSKRNCSDKRASSQCQAKERKGETSPKSAGRRERRSKRSSGRSRVGNEFSEIMERLIENQKEKHDENRMKRGAVEIDEERPLEVEANGGEGQWRMQERSGRRRRATMKLRNRLWKNGVVVYRMGREIRPEAKRVIQRAFNHIQQRTCIRFREKKDSDRDFIRFISEPGCWSQIGRVGGTQMVSLGRGCESLGTAVHEITHSLGVWHEQARPDRNRYVKILEENVSERFRPDFEAVGRRLATDRGYPYDYQSLMHYSQYAFTRNGEPTIQVIGTGRRLKLRIGQRRGLSTIDISQLRDMYKCNQRQDRQETVCHEGWEKHLTSCYKFVTSNPAQFDAAHRACKREKANLVVIDNSREQRFIDKIIGEKHSRVTRWRTAGRKVNGTMIWYLDEKKMKNITRYKNWAWGHPASRTSLVLYRDPRSGRVKWIGDWAGDSRNPNYYRHPFICKRPAWRKCVELRYRDGRDYRGHLDHTREGYTCQRWTENYPHDHPLVNVSRAAAAWMRASRGSNSNRSSSAGGQQFSDGLGTHNKCRNPSGLRRNRPWCYTSKRRHEWGYCDVSACASSLRRTGRGRSRSPSSRQSSATRGRTPRRGTTREITTRQGATKDRPSSRQGAPNRDSFDQRSPRQGNKRRAFSRQVTPKRSTARKRTSRRGTPWEGNPRPGTARGLSSRLDISTEKTSRQFASRQDISREVTDKAGTPKRSTLSQRIAGTGIRKSETPRRKNTRRRKPATRQRV